MTYDATTLIENAFDLSARATRTGLVADWSTNGNSQSNQPGAYALNSSRAPYAWHKIFLPATLPPGQSATVTITDNPSEKPPASGDTYLIVWTGPENVTDAMILNNPSIMSQVAYSDDDGGNSKGRVSFDGTPYFGKWLYIAHGTYSNQNQWSGQTTKATAPYAAGLGSASGASGSSGAAYLSGGRVFIYPNSGDGASTGGVVGIKAITPPGFAVLVESYWMKWGVRDGFAARREVPFQTAYLPDEAQADDGGGGGETVPTTGQIWPRGSY